MKKIFSISLSLFLSVFIHAQQVNRDMVIVEIAVGFWCTYCPGASMGADDLIDNGHNVAILQNHGGDSLANIYSDGRNDYNDISGFPTATFDGILSVVGGSATESLYPNYLPKVNQRNALLSDFTIDLTFTNQGDNYQAIVDVENVGGNTSSDLVLQLGVTESNLPISWGGMNHVSFVTRRFVPDHNGTLLDFTSGDFQSEVFDFTIEDYWDSENCELIAFVQDNTTKEILQGTKMSLGTPPGLNADFSADVTEVCTGGNVTFTDQSTGPPTSWNWSFPGGNPSTATGIGPYTIAYNTPGSYNVSLIVGDGESTDTITKTEYVSIQDIIADFTGFPTTIFEGQTVTFTDNSACNPTSWNWLFTGGTPAFASGQGPHTITYPSAGTYDVSLSVSNASFDDTETKTDYINVTNCSFCATSYSNQSDDWISNVSFNTINNSSEAEEPDGYADYTDQVTTVDPGSIHTISVDVTVNGDWIQNAWVWIDWNQNCDFTDPGEAYDLDETPGTEGTFTLSTSITIPEDALPGITRMRVAERYAYDPEPCTETTYGESEDYSVEITGGSIDINLTLTVMLEGPFNIIAMNPELTSVLPLDQPYNAEPWNYTGSETVGSIPNGNVVDWILVELRDAASTISATPGTSIGKQAAFILTDGSIVALDGSSNLQFSVSVYQNLYVVIWHRNHLGIMSNNALVQSGGVYSYDFSSGLSQVYGESNGHKDIAPGVWGMFSGDGTADGIVNANDKSILWENETGTNGYIPSDYNLDGESNNIDKDEFWLPNISKECQVPD